jgi:hypothetical protein
MFKILSIWLFLQPFLQNSPIENVRPSTESCNCPSVTPVLKVGEAPGTIVISWTGHEEADEYKVWYVRVADGYTSEYLYTENESYTFSGLSAGLHIFKVAAVCGNATSPIVGIQDIITL